MSEIEKTEKKPRGKYVAHIDGSKCIGCGGCKRNCKFDAISRGKEYYIIDKDRCTGCRICVKVCPAEAIDYGEREE
ncbi:4Fe-4S dicluster domain-containing protein [Aminipila butyrica]|uniref:4Fe-4S dicluster domain-containing protein n=1 Tax=Aminipila butyrica TaxID=433296 RepID=A0A858BXM4_9FIRM|nr:4Fe-4S dicluster domain-containing protein [Aminipila butyrica]QIB69858.1 4Fe-4S dicluster domain-containing protein [Aminipila butyrica]